MQDKHFQKRFSKLNNINNFEKQSFIPLNADHNNHDNSDPFKFCNSLEEFFDELKCKNDNKAKIMDELKRHEEGKTKPKNEMKRTNNLKRKPADEVEDYMPFKLEKDENLERSLERYAYKGSVKPRKRSTLPTFLKKADKMFEPEMNRFFKKKAAGRYAYKGRGIMGNTSNYYFWRSCISNGYFIRINITSNVSPLSTVNGCLYCLDTMRLNSIVHHVEV
ncbi:hypothetical protein PVT01_140005200 [Plasmodium vivax]|uniref:Uncharacterized protein n=1 Tax=Plasmodium vivax TaxID=5855 RepID=A0A1G4H3Y5_PLAVI|nr:hypothetical protein PVT01_140005200 [Plasmodium vivax]